MPVRLSEEDLRDPAHSRILNIRHEFDPECDGLVCKLYHKDSNGQPIQPRLHLHVILEGEDPPTSPRCYPVYIPKIKPDLFDIAHDRATQSVLFKFTGPVEFTMSLRPELARRIALDLLNEADNAEGKEKPIQ